MERNGKRWLNPSARAEIVRQFATSLVGSQAVQFALIWWLTETSGSATILATAALLGLPPPIVLGPVSGALIDRWNRKTVMLAADGFVAAASFLLAGLFYTGIANIPHVLALLFVRAIGAAFHSPSMTASTHSDGPGKAPHARPGSQPEHAGPPHGGAAQSGWLSSSFGVGLIVGGVALGVWGGFRRRIVDGSQS